MATWKKVIVSGSSAELAALKVDNLTSGQVVIGGGSAGNLSTTAINGSGNIVATTNATGLSHSGSFSGSFSGNGTNLTGVTATAIFPTTQLTPIGSAAQVFVNDGANKYATVSQFTSASWAGITGDILINGSGVSTIQANAVALATDISGFGAGVTGALAIATGSVGSVVINGGALGTPSSGTLTNATGLPISGLVSSTSTALGVGSLELGHATDTTFTRVSAGVAAIEGNNIITANNFGTGILTFLGTPSSANFATALTDETGTAGSVVFSAGPTLTGTTNVASLAASGNVTITGNLNVAGTASFTNTDNLTIADKFILINSGSSTLTDSGWITQYNVAGSGSAFYLEAASSGTYGRFAVAYDVIGTSTSLTVDEFNVTAKINQASNPAAAPTWGGATNGAGNMWITNAGDIFIYG